MSSRGFLWRCQESRQLTVILRSMFWFPLDTKQAVRTWTEAWGLGLEKALLSPLWAALCFSRELISCRPLPSLNLSCDNEQQVWSETQTTPRGRQESKAHVTLGYDCRTNKRYGFTGLTSKRRWWSPMLGTETELTTARGRCPGSLHKATLWNSNQGLQGSKARRSFPRPPSAAPCWTRSVCCVIHGKLLDLSGMKVLVKGEAWFRLIPISFSVFKNSFPLSEWTGLFFHLMTPRWIWKPGRTRASTHWVPTFWKLLRLGNEITEFSG